MADMDDQYFTPRLVRLTSHPPHLRTLKIRFSFTLKLSIGLSVVPSVDGSSIPTKDDMASSAVCAIARPGSRSRWHVDRQCTRVIQRPYAPLSHMLGAGCAHQHPRSPHPRPYVAVVPHLVRQPNRGFGLSDSRGQSKHPLLKNRVLRGRVVPTSGVF